MIVVTPHNITRTPAVRYFVHVKTCASRSCVISVSSLVSVLLTKLNTYGAYTKRICTSTLPSPGSRAGRAPGLDHCQTRATFNSGLLSRNLSILTHSSPVGLHSVIFVFLSYNQGRSTICGRGWVRIIARYETVAHFVNNIRSLILPGGTGAKSGNSRQCCAVHFTQRPSNPSVKERTQGTVR